jgi:hypothetical protein
VQDHPARSIEGESDDLGRERDRKSRQGTRVRIDGGSASGDDLAPGCGSLLRAFSAWERPAGAERPSERLEAVTDRRLEPRHHHVECLAWVGWKIWRGFRTKDAVLINLSRGGARIFLDEKPPTGRPVWVFLETPGNTAIIKAEVRDTETTRQGQCLVRVGFLEVCPYALFEAAVCGLASADPRARIAAAPPRMARVAAPGWRARRPSNLRNRADR